MRYCILNGANEIEISETLWSDLNEMMSRDDIKQFISDTIEQNNVPMPMREISLNDARDSHLKLRERDCNPVQGKWFTRYDYSDQYPLNDLYFPSDTTGNLSSDYFHQESRWHCDSINSPSPYRSWTVEKFRLTLFNALWSMKLTKVTSKELRSIIGLRKYIASQFRPSTAKGVYELFKADRVLDFSSGWGDRLSGFMATGGSLYTGVDPNKQLISGYKDQLIFRPEHQTINMLQGCSEDMPLEPHGYDLVFTSPPYYNIERYTQEDDQSFKRYRKIDDWNKNFLHRALSNAWQVLDKGGHMIINISDVYSNHTVNKICDEMNDFILSLPDSNYVGCIGYQMRQRPNSGALKNKEGIFAEPMWVWQRQ